MQQVFPSTMLRTNLGEVKRAATEDEVIITDKGNAQYVFASEEIFASALARAWEEAAYSERMARTIRRARAGIAQGDFVAGAEAAIAEADRRAGVRG